MKKRNSLFRSISQVLLSNRGSVGGDADVDYEAIAKEAYAEVDAERNGTPLPKKEEKKEEEATPKESPKPKEEGEDKGDNESNEDQTDETEDTPAEESEETSETDKLKDDKKDEKDEDALITEHAQKHGMTYAEAKEDIEKINTIVEQFKNDPKEMARAIRNKDREYDKLKNESTKIEKEEPAFERLSEDEFRREASARIEESREKWINAYKSRYPAKSEMMSEEAIIEEILDREWVGYQSFAQKKEGEVKYAAQKRREDFITGISEADRKFIPEVKAMLYQIKDKDILSPHWKPEYLIHLAKGKRYDQDIKAAEDAAAKRAKEDVKILGVKGGGSQKPSSSKTGTGAGLNAEQKHRALDMFPVDDGYTEDRAYQMFKETYAEELKANPNFV